jgi:type I restriction enzyme M protein
MASLNGHVNFIWSIAERLRGPFKQHQYGTIILPLTLLRRLDTVLAPTKEKVLAEAAKYEGRGLNLDPILKRAAGQQFYNASKLTLEKAYADADYVASHLLEYIAGFDPIVRDIFEAFRFETTIGELQKADRLYSVLGKFLDPELNLHPDAVPNDVMGDIFEELIRRFSEISNETAGEHFTPREVVRLCAELVLAGDERLLSTPGIVRSVYDPACGTGGMLSVMEEIVRERNPQARLVLFGQEVNPESWAVCRAEMLVKGQDPSRIAPGSTLSADGNEGQRFDYMLANPPFGVDWADDYEAVAAEHERLGADGRFGAGLPRKSDGALLFLQNMLGKRKPASEDAGSRITIVFNGSPLFSGGAGSGESEIRKWVIENDWLEAIVALPEQLFYNTGLATYIWVLTDRKSEEREGKIQLIDARKLWEPLPRNLGDKRRRLSLAHIEQIIDCWRAPESADARATVLPNEFFGYRRIVVEQPLRLRYELSDATRDALLDQQAFQKLTDAPKGASDEQREVARAAGEERQEQILTACRSLGDFSTTDKSEMAAKLGPAFATLELSAALKKAVWDAVSVRDPDAPIVSRRGGGPEPDPGLRATENVPLLQSVEEYVQQEVQPYLDNYWLDETKTRVGYELPFTRIFYDYKPPRPVEEIDQDLVALEERVQALLAKMADASSRP